MSVLTGTPSFLLIAPKNARPLVPGYPSSTIFIDLAVASPLYQRGDVVHSDVPLQPLKEIAPALLAYLTIDGTRIVLPRSDAIDIPLLINLVDLIVSRHHTTGAFDLDLLVLPQEPVKMIRLHVLLDIFGLKELVDELVHHMSKVFGSCTLTLADVMWFWVVLGPERERDMRWTPVSAEVYKQMLAWGILNAEKEERLSEDLKAFLRDVESKGKPCFLTGLLEKRLRHYGLGFEELTMRGSARRTRGDSVIERDGRKNDPAVEHKIEPLSQSRPQSVVPLYVPLGCSFHECEAANKVKVMAAQRDDLLRARQLEAFAKLKDPEGNHPVFQDFGYPGWCESKGKPIQR